MFEFTHIAYAAADTPGVAEAQRLVGKINDAILFPLIALMMAIAFIVFLYGAFEYVKNANNETARETGRNHLLYGVIGMLVMLSAMAILQMAAGTFGLQNELENVQRDRNAGNDFLSGGGSAVNGPSRIPRPTPPSSVYTPTDISQPPISNTPPEVTTDLGLDGFGSSPAVGTAPNIPQGVEEFSFAPRPVQPLTSQEKALYERYVDTYTVDQLPGRTEALNAQDVQNVLSAYESFGVTEVVFMTDMVSVTGTQSSAGALSQQEALCAKKGGELTLESGPNKVTSRSMYICLR